MDSCPDAQTVDDFVAGRLPPVGRRAIEAHVDGCPSCHQVVARVMSRMSDPPPPPLAPPPTAARVTVLPGAAATTKPPGAAGAPSDFTLVEGHKVGRYIILGNVGAGGMGTVVAAYDTALDRKIALKFLISAPSDEAALAQVLAEASAMARLSHPNVVTVHDVGVFGGKPYLAMELVDGTTLSAWRRKQPRSFAEIARVMAGAARGLAAAHAAGLVHRDVKPQNILVAGARVLVTDFGLSVGAQATATAGVVAGTPAYMAPEQLRGETVDPRADVFGLCATLFEMIHGEPPFSDGKTVALAERPAAARVPVVPFGSKAPAHLHRLAMRGLAPVAADRPADMNALADELLADPAAARRRATVAVAALAVVAGAFWGGGYLKANPERRCRAGAEAMAATWNDGTRAQLRDRYQAAGKAATWPVIQQRLDEWARGWRAMYGDTCAATYGQRRQSEAVLDLRMDCLYAQRSTVDALVRSLAAATPEQLMKAASGRLPLVAECDAAGRAGARPIPGDEQSRTALRAIDDGLGQAAAQIILGDFEAAGRANRKALDGARALAYEPVLARAFTQGAAIETRMGRGGGPGAGDRAAGMLAQAIAAAEVGRDDLRRADAMSDLVMTNVFRDRYPDAELWAGLASALLTKIGDPPAQRASLEWSVGWLKFYQGQRDVAAAAFDRSLALRQKILSPNNPLVISSLNGSCTARPTIEQQVACFRTAVKLGEATYGARHSDMASLYNNLATGLVKRPKTLDEGCALIRKAVEIKQASIDPAHPSLLDDINNLAWCLNAQGKLREARALFEQGVARAAPKTAARARLQDGYGLLLASLGEAGEGLRHLREALDHRRATFGPTHHLVLETAVDLGNVLLDEKRPADALAEADAGIAACASAKATPALLVEVHNLRGRALAAQGKPREALAAHQEALRLHGEIASRTRTAPAATRPPEVAESGALHGIGAAQLALGDTAAAVTTLERALALRAPGEVAPELRAQTGLLLAQALVAAGDDGATRRACELGAEAVAGFTAAGDRVQMRDELRRARRWLADRRCAVSL
jgi:eukaryotic-like serine/threonine-protein kinase